MQRWVYWAADSGFKCNLVIKANQWKINNQGFCEGSGLADLVSKYV